MIPALAIVCALACAPVVAAEADPHPVVSYSRPASFADVRDDLKMAIESRGLVIDYNSHIQRMLERTGTDLGAQGSLYKNAEAFVFCSASLSRKMMQADPANIAMCPYSMVVYVTAQDPARVHVSFRRPWRPDGSAASRASLKEIETLLDGLAREALGLN